MIAFVRGKFARKTPSQIIVDVNGVGYELQISLHTYSSISNKEEGQLHTYLHITENGQTLFGFATQGEKDLFLQLISVSGVGASTARMMLSGLQPDEIIKGIVQGNTKQLESVKGIGKKTAERIIVELRDKLAKISLETGVNSNIVFPSTERDAVTALTGLGIARAMAESAVKKVSDSAKETLSLEDIIKQALKNL
ncbi:Holliday junction branch migration protein RuvA [Panacibacter ginsenosidivorans]|uniref:Holliday junction branch migration complex subunit RuvA n=1 Tax=Panacibacter ginsenosidivorans TaxID=1813871 RepID=A0A5B8V4U8_9BACT|nr:Holliday junction branch migration protein RuvA [Panacibacter ginsenosidivorans]QEC66055.1 Holliday junction branch migration protein RuvA [Panacibacter ginsenosidivorans]